MLLALGDPSARQILLALTRSELDARGLVLRTGLPQSSVYRKLKELDGLGLVEVGRLAFTPDGKKVEVYRSRLREVRIQLSAAGIRVQVRGFNDGAERLGRMWEAVRSSGR